MLVEEALDPEGDRSEMAWRGQAHHRGQSGESCWRLQLDTWPVLFFCFWLCPESLLPDKPQSPSGASSWLPDQSDCGLAAGINHGECWWCDFYRLVFNDVNTSHYIILY